MKKIKPREILDLQSRSSASNNSRKNSNPILSLDYGEKFCGLAWSPDKQVIFPIKIIKTSEIYQEILAISKDKNITEIVIGIPIQAGGTENENCQKIREFAKKLDTNFTVHLVDEKFSTTAVSSLKNERIDDLSAGKILEYFLEKL